MADIKFDKPFREDDIRRFEQAFKAIGSTEYVRAIQFALDETAKKAVKGFRTEMPKALGVTSPNGWKENRYTLYAVRYERSRKYDAFTRSSDLTSSVFIDKSKSAYLKYLFGYSTNDRGPGDVGLASDRILIPDSGNLTYTQSIAKMRDANGRLPSDLMKQIKQQWHQSNSDATLMFGGGSSMHNQKWRDAMKSMGSDTARSSHMDIDKATGQSLVVRDWLHHLARGKHDHILNKNGGINRLTKGSVQSRMVGAGGKWPVFQGPDRTTGERTYFSRGPRVRDPSGGCHTFQRSDGTTAKMPNMLSYDPITGNTGSAAGPHRLFHAVSRVKNRPILQEPWEDAANAAYAAFEGFMEKELDNRLIRRANNRRY